MKKYLVLGIPLIIFVFIVFYCGNDSYYKNQIAPLKFDGLVVDKYRDKIGDYPRLTIDNYNGRQILTIYDSDRSGFYKYVEKGDSIKKDSGELIFYVKRNENMKKFKIVYERF